MPSSTRHIFLAVSVGILAALWTTSCDHTFEPLQDNNQYVYSMYGYLDAVVDSQWVRIMPVRDTLFSDPVPIDATVTLEHLESGETAVMNDSLFHYRHDAYAWNFWTTMTLEPAQTYRLIAERSDGAASSVTVTLPEDFPPPLVMINDGTGVGDRIHIVSIEDVEHLVDVQAIYHVQHHATGEEQLFSIPQIEHASSTAAGYQVNINQTQDEQYIKSRIEGEVTISRKQVFVASAGPDWVDFPNIDEAIIALPDGVSNVEHGVGYLVGIVSKTVPFESCFDEDSARISCPPEERL